MKFHLDGSIVINAPIEKVYTSLTTPEFMGTTIPDLESFKVVDPEHFEARVKVGISIVRGTVEMKFAIQDKRATSHAKLVGDGAGAGSKMHIESVFDLVPDSSGTKMRWAADADLNGLMAGIGSQILKGQSEKQVSQIFSNIKKKIEN